MEKKVSPATQNQALNPMVFVYRQVLEKDIKNWLDAVRAKNRRRLPVVLTVKEVEKLRILAPDAESCMIPTLKN